MMGAWMDEAELKAWIGKTETAVDVIAPFPANALAATFDRDDPPYDAGVELPPLWHWLYFLKIYKMSEAGYDGHEALGGFLPPVPLPRRMWAGSQLRFVAPVRIGQRLTKVSTIENVVQKEGRSGKLVFVTVRHRYSDGETLLIDETHDIVYRAADTGAAPPPPKPAPQTAGFSRVVTPGPVLLFRYSALTFNGHRIHYDHPFCTQHEGYEGLVVHGPLLATLMLDLLRREKSGARVTSFRFRAMAPVVDTADFSVCGADEDGGVRLWIRRADGALAMEGMAEIEEAE